MTDTGGLLIGLVGVVVVLLPLLFCALILSGRQSDAEREAAYRAQCEIRKAGK